MIVEFIDPETGDRFQTEAPCEAHPDGFALDLIERSLPADRLPETRAELEPLLAHCRAGGDRLR